jgi:microcin C transport system permease protein
MLQYLLRRFLLMIPTLLGITVVVFVIVQSAPGGPIEQAMQAISGQPGQAQTSGESVMSQEVIEELKAQYGFDKPVLVRYGNWLKNLATFNFGESYVYEEPVIDVIKSKFPVSIQFGLTSLFCAYVICIPLGIAKALRDRSRFDYITSIMMFLAHSTPGFVLGILLIIFFGGGSFLDLFPLGGTMSDNYEFLSTWGQLKDRVHHAVLPIVCYMVAHLTVLTMLMKNSLIGELRKDYVKTAVSKGAPRGIVIYKHALRNALIPIVTGMGGVFSIIFAGSVLIETVFNLDGVGLLTYTSIMKRDYPVIMASVTIHSFLIMLGNIFSDTLLALVDPRIDFE